MQKNLKSTTYKDTKKIQEKQKMFQKYFIKLDD